jgi:hypothetical protein
MAEDKGQMLAESKEVGVAEDNKAYLAGRQLDRYGGR